MGGMGGSQSNTAKQAQLASKARNVLQQQRSQPNARRIPNQLVADARCIAVFPSVVQAGFILGGHHGKGLVTCRQKSGGFDSANPAVYSLSGGSIGLQAGAQKSSIILLFTTRQSVNALLQSKIKLGSQISVTAGPSGYNHPITQTPAPVVAYVMSQKGLYAGIDLSGTKMSFAQSANASLYGPSATPEGVLLGSMQSAGVMSSFKQALMQFAPSGGSQNNSGGNQQQSQQTGSNQSQMSGGQQQSGANHSGMNSDQQQPGTNQSGMDSGQQQSGANHSGVNSDQQQPGTNQSEMNSGQQQPGSDQSGMNSGQQQPGTNQSEMNSGQQQPGSDQSGMNSGQQQPGTNQSEMNSGQQQPGSDQSGMSGGQQRPQQQSGADQSSQQSNSQYSQQSSNGQ